MCERRSRLENILVIGAAAQEMRISEESNGLLRQSVGVGESCLPSVVGSEL